MSEIFEKYGKKWKIIETKLFDGTCTYHVLFAKYHKKYWFFGPEIEWWDPLTEVEWDSGGGQTSTKKMKSIVDALAEIEKFKANVSREVSVAEINIVDIK